MAEYTRSTQDVEVVNDIFDVLAKASDRSEDEAVSTQTFSYTPLPDDKSFRLLKLAPSSPGKTDCDFDQLEVFPLDQHPSYKSVSYVWEHTDQRARLRLGTTERNILLITPQAYNMLQWLRDETQYRWLWIDAICIDQQSLDERSSQVRLMGDIFSNAQGVIAWIEEEWDSYKFVLQNLHLDTVGDTGVWNTAARNDLEGFIRHKFWSRKWILQELIQAQEITIQVEGVTRPMSEIIELLDNFHSNMASHQWTAYLLENGSAIQNIARHIIDRRRRRDDMLYTLLIQYRQVECTDPHDHIYALYNLISRRKEHLQVDYSLSLADMCALAIRFMCQYERMSESQVMWMAQLLLHTIIYSDTPSAVDCSPSLSSLTGSIPVSVRSLGRLTKVKDGSLSSLLRSGVKGSFAQLDGWMISRERKNVVKVNAGTSVEVYSQFHCFHVEARNRIGRRLFKEQMLCLADVGNDGAQIFMFDNTSLALVVDTRVVPWQVLGRAVLFLAAELPGSSRYSVFIDPRQPIRQYGWLLDHSHFELDSDRGHTSIWQVEAKELMRLAALVAGVEEKGLHVRSVANRHEMKTADKLHSLPMILSPSTPARKSLWRKFA